jgi:arylsulfatase A-like enzyme
VRRIDVAPTILAILGVPPADTVQGRALRLCGKHGDDHSRGKHGHEKRDD